MTPVLSAGPEAGEFALAHSSYLGEVARLDGTLRAARDAGVWLASRALAAEGDAIAGLALTIAAGAGSSDVQAAERVAAAATAESTAALAKLGLLCDRTRLCEAAEVLLAAASLCVPAVALGSGWIA
ncbi:hypothetical protein FDG2_0440 [Candidatus Protofrankia californiensis]|uniref:Uncharacterized protein n=1 Tax=Candidatus Protofrankia californiensis TaxID=1839754 RepID=A0A1C3NTJ1_9ACTN|nr:hypothetical protein FDG2_0440 [Candidatus Protofrankia californiensis]